MKKAIAAIGEVMAEFSPGQIEDSFQLGFAGDTFNTAVGLARLDADTRYVTLLGDDRFSDRILTLMQREGVSTDCIERLPGRQPGLYIISNDDRGERSFRYWRSEAPARELWSNTHSTPSVEEQLLSCSHIYLSGITLAIMQPQARDRLKNFLSLYRQQGGVFAFDSNYRPRLWGNSDIARSVVAQFLAISDIALLTVEDEQLLWGLPSAEELIKHHSQHAITELIIKRGSEPVLLFECGQLHCVDVPPVASIVDTTGAGDAFNAGYLAGRLQGKSAVEAVALGNRAAGAVIRHRGGIIAREHFLSAVNG